MTRWTPGGGQGVEIERRRCHERLSLAGLHLGDVALVEDDPTHHLNVEHPLLRLTPARLPDCRERLEEELLERFSVRQPLPELGGLREELCVGERLEVRLERGDIDRLLLEPLHASPLAQAKDLLELAEIGGGHLEERTGREPRPDRFFTNSSYPPTGDGPAPQRRDRVRAVPARRPVTIRSKQPVRIG